MIANLLVGLFGGIIFLFIFWKKLKEDYASEIIFSSAFMIFAAMLVSYFVSLKFFPKWFFWSEFVAVAVGLWLSILRFRMKGYEVLDAAVISILPWLSIFFLKDSVLATSFSSFIGFVVILVFISIYYFLDLNYKSFVWYRSGRIGFSGLATLSLFFLARSAIAIKFPTVLSFVVKYDPYISGALAFAGFLLIFNLSRKLD